MNRRPTPTLIPLADGHLEIRPAEGECLMSDNKAPHKTRWWLMPENQPVCRGVCLDRLLKRDEEVE